MPAFAQSLGAALCALALAVPAHAADKPKARLVSCDAGSCLLVKGRRDSAAALVMINGHAVSVEGGRRWRAIVPVDTLRDWAAPKARTITVAVADAEAASGAVSEVRLPIGLLGQPEDLAFLVIRAK